MIPRYARNDKRYARNDKRYARNDKRYARNDKCYAGNDILAAFGVTKSLRSEWKVRTTPQFSCYCDGRADPGENGFTDSGPL